MARHDIRGVKIPDGSYTLAAKDIHNLNDNFIQVSKLAFGNSDFSEKLDKKVKKIATSVSELETTVGDLDADYTAIRQDVDNIDLSVNGVDGAFAKITLLQDAVSTKVTSSYVDTAISNMNSRGLNLVSNLAENWTQADAETIVTTNGYGIP